MNHSIEKNEQYVLITLDEIRFGETVAGPLEKVVVTLYREGFTNMILDLESVETVNEDALSLIRKITKVCRNEGGLFVVVSIDDDLLDAIDGAKIPELVMLSTIDEAIDVVLMNDTNDDFPEEDDDEYFANQELE